MMIKDDLVTVAIPAYNHQNYVQATMRSIIAQTHRNIELVIFNDGSTDNTDSRIKELQGECQKRFVRFDYISKENEGLAATWNRAIDWAQADYLYTIASDDVAEPHAIETLYEFLSKHNDYALAAGDNAIIDGSGQRCGWDINLNNTASEKAVYHTVVEMMKAKRKNRGRFKPKKYGTYKTLIKANYVTNGKLFRRQSLIEVGKYVPGMKLEDWYINLQLAKRYRMKLVNDILLSYRWHGANTIRDTNYLKNSREAIWQYEYENHPKWFKKYATRKIKKIIKEIV